jgi:hypothetical protein
MHDLQLRCKNSAERSFQRDLLTPSPPIPIPLSNLNPNSSSRPKIQTEPLASS